MGLFGWIFLLSVLGELLGPVSALWVFHINNQKPRPHASVNREDGGGASLIQADELLRSCFEFISEDIGWMFLMILFHHLMSIASYVRINDGTKGQKQAPIAPK